MTRARGWPRSRLGDDGAAVPMVMAGVGVLLALTAGLGSVGSAVLARHRAEAAADLAALAAAGTLADLGTGSPCTAARQVAAANGAALRTCQVVAGAGGGLEAVVATEVAWRPLVPWPDAPTPARARARAGVAPREPG